MILLTLDLGLLAAIATSPRLARTVGGLPASIPGQQYSRITTGRPSRSETTGGGLSRRIPSGTTDLPPGASTVAYAYAYAEALRGSGVLAAIQIAYGLLARDPFSYP